MASRSSLHISALSAGIYLSFFTMMPKGFAQPVRILFDASKAEMAGNADWVIDADQTNIRYGSAAYLSGSGNQSNPQITPTPAQSGITSSTTETYWTGALSSWGVDCAKKGYTVETLPYNGQITYKSTSNLQDLSNYQVYIIDEPNIMFTSAEKTAILQYIKDGGSLFMIADHKDSDRNGDGHDSPEIWNDLLSNNTEKNYPFGIYFDLVDFSQTTTNISATSTDPIINGPMGKVLKTQWAGGTTMTLDPVANPSVKGVVFKSGTTPGNSNAMVAYATYGKGKVAAMGDSSPSDDGTGNPNCTLYNGYLADASGNHRLLLMNTTIWLATKSTTGIYPATATESTEVSVYPNPATGLFNITASQTLKNVHISVFNQLGQIVLDSVLPTLDDNNQMHGSLSPGFYFVKVQSDNNAQTIKVNVR